MTAPTHPGLMTQAEILDAEHAGDPIVVAFEAADDAVHSFRVDAKARTVSGVVVPWNKVASNGWAKWKFASNSLHWSQPSRIKLNRHHDRTDLVARATRLESIGEGLDATYQFGRNDAATAALQDAEDELLDGFSIEIAFDEDAGDSWQPDPVDESVRLVTRATLKGTALTGGPAFDDARVKSVKASRDQLAKGSPDMAPKTGTETPAAGTDGAAAFDFEDYADNLGKAMIESHKRLVTDLATSLGDTITEGVRAALENIHDPQRDGPQPVRAARFAVTREAPVYQLNGSGDFSIVRDAWYAAQARDQDALERLRKHHRQTEDIAKLAAHMVASANFATVTTTVGAAVIPPGYRPDLYIPQLQQGRPMVSACSPGVINNATPFVVPVFGSATGATADHVEGTNATDGSLAFTTKTVTPGAIDGLLRLTREIVDSSNPAIDAIALGAMRESYARQTEAKVYTLLNGANGAGGTITTGFVPSGAQAATFAATGGTPFAEAALVKGMRQRVAAYPFNRFASPDVALMGANATSILAGAMDSTGRPIFPSIGGTNSIGGGNAYTQGWDVDGLAFIPAWAMTGVAAGDSQELILNRSDAWVWESPLLTFRYEERSGPANVDLVLFGYFATHLLRPVGLSGIRIT